MKRPLVSVVIPVYNIEKYIQRCVESILRQNYKEFEIVLIDDGSTDNSGRICDMLASTSDKIRVFHKENQGVSIARNLGLSEAIGDYITFVDSDDYVSPQYIEHLVNGAKQESCGLVQAGFIAKRTTSQEEVKCIDKETLTEDGEIIFKKIRGFVCSKLFLRDVIITHGIEFSPELTLAEDLCFVLDYIYHIRKVRFIEATDYYYNIRDGSASKKIHKFTNLYTQIVKEYNLVLRLYEKWPKAHVGFEYRQTLLAKSVFNLLSNLYQYNTKECIMGFLSDFPDKYTNLLEYYPQDKLLNRFVARLAYKHHWKILNVIFKLKKLYRNRSQYGGQEKNCRVYDRCI